MYISKKFKLLYFKLFRLLYLTKINHTILDAGKDYQEFIHLDMIRKIKWLNQL